jgi:hypothetical protein
MKRPKIIANLKYKNNKGNKLHMDIYEFNQEKLSSQTQPAELKQETSQGCPWEGRHQVSWTPKVGDNLLRFYA